MKSHNTPDWLKNLLIGAELIYVPAVSGELHRAKIESYKIQEDVLIGYKISYDNTRQHIVKDGNNKEKRYVIYHKEASVYFDEYGDATNMYGWTALEIT